MVMQGGWYETDYRSKIPLSTVLNHFHMMKQLPGSNFVLRFSTLLLHPTLLDFSFRVNSMT